jgi:predicted enzyme related to lactoylglutathione lyase
MFTIKRLNHIVLYVRDAQRSLAFYRDVLGFQVVEAPGPQAVFLRAHGSDNHHDLGLFGIGNTGAPSTGGARLGLYHAAWEVATLEDLVEARQALASAARCAASPTTATASASTRSIPTASSSRCSGCCRARSGPSAASVPGRSIWTARSRRDARGEPAPD